MRRYLMICLAVLLPLQAAAQDTKAKPTTQGPRRDPTGVAGISPHWEALKKGDSAYIAGDYDAAISAYREAITAQPQNALGHLRMGEAQLGKGDMDEAEKSYSAALRFAAADAALKAKALFLLSDLLERRRAYADAKERWKAYADFAKQQAQAKTYPATATDRTQRLEQWQKLLADNAIVKERIAKRLEEADKKARESAK